MNSLFKTCLFLALAGLLSAGAAVPVSYRAAAGETWERVAVKHGVTADALQAANPGVTGVTEDWIRLPEGARLPDEPAIALMASASAEIAEIVRDARIDGVYRIVGREFHTGTWGGRTIVAGVAGGNMNNAAIGTTVLLQHFNVRAMGFVGIAGGGGTTRVGDVLVASGAVQHDQGNWYDFERAGGGIAAGLTWHQRGQPVLADTGREGRLVLFPQAELLARIRESVTGLELPEIGAEVAAFHGVERYRPSVLTDGWSASGAQFVTSHEWRTTVERRVALAAERLGVPPPAHLIVDQEDFAAVQAAEEHGVPWFIVRVVVDLAAQKQAAAGVPWILADTPEKIPAWLAEHGQQSHAKQFDWSYFYRQVARVAKPIVQALGGERSARSAD